MLWDRAETKKKSWYKIDQFIIFLSQSLSSGGSTFQESTASRVTLKIPVCSVLLAFNDSWLVTILVYTDWLILTVVQMSMTKPQLSIDLKAQNNVIYWISQKQNKNINDIHVGYNFYLGCHLYQSISRICSL